MPTATAIRAPASFPRRPLTVDEVYRMVEAGIIDGKERFELIEGELIAMSAKNNAHEFVKGVLNLAVARALPEHLWLGVETTIRLTRHTFVEPDLAIYPRGLVLEDVRGPDIILAVEVSDSSLAYDRRVKRPLYARHGFAEFWLVNARDRTTTIHRHPGPDGWGSVIPVPRDAALTHPALPGFSVTLGDAV